jgi:hypothetical protein
MNVKLLEDAKKTNPLESGWQEGILSYLLLQKTAGFPDECQKGMCCGPFEGGGSHSGDIGVGRSADNH